MNMSAGLAALGASRAEVFSVSSILYYLEPAAELGDPLFRFGTYRGIIFPEILALVEADPQLDVTVVLGEALYEEAKRSALVDPRITYAIVPCGVIAIDPVEAYCGRVDEASRAAAIRTLRLTTQGASPELVLAYENASDFLHLVWPAARILHVTFGCFSRAPFPTLAAFDPLGTYGKSFLARHSDRIRAYAPGADELCHLRSFRRTALRLLSSYMPYKREIAHLRQKYRKVVLFPCQVNDHYSVAGTSPYASHAEAVRALAAALPDDWGVLLTMHKYQPAIAGDALRALTQEFPNVEAFENRLDVPDVSQFLAPYVDGVAVVSSSMGFQAALWGVPLLVLGEAHLAPLADCRTPEAFRALLERPGLDPARFDNALCFLIFRYNVAYRTTVFRGERFLAFLNQLHASLLVDPGGADFFFTRSPPVAQIGRDLLESFTEHVLKKSLAGVPLQQDHLSLAISRHKIVSFDLFDTLVDRPFAEPHDAFLAVERRVQSLEGLRKFPFARLRRQAEADVRRPTGGALEITIDDIYDRLADLGGLDDERRSLLLSMEIDLELQICRKKVCVVPYLRLARLVSNGVVVASDFYIGEDFVRRLLEANDIYCDRLLVSATTRVRKHNGGMFKLVADYAREKGAARNEILHIGDNATADLAMAKNAGLWGYLTPSALSNLKRSLIGSTQMRQILTTRSLASSALVGLVASRLYSAAFNQLSPRSVYDGKLFNIGYAAYGPLMLGFSQWVRLETTKRNIIDVFFLARDGKIIKDVYEAACGGGVDQNVHYLKTSRRALRVAALRSASDVFDLAWQNFNSQPFHEYLENRFGFLLTEAHRPLLRAAGLRREAVVSPDHDIGRISKALKLLMPEILASAERERVAYLRYLDEIGFLSAARAGTVAVVDIGYSGSIQLGLEALVPEAKIEGFYLLTHEVGSRDFGSSRFHGYLSNLDDHLNGFRHPLNNHVFLLETGFSSLEGSLVKMEIADGAARGVFLEAASEASRVRLLTDLHRGALAFARDFEARLGGVEREHICLAPALAASQILQFAEKPTAADAACFIGCEVENVFGGGSVSLIEPNHAPLGGRDLVDHLVRASAWKAGARCVYASGEAPPPAKKPPKAAPIKIQRGNRKLAKLAHNPWLFFNDSKRPALRGARHLFGDHAIGTVGAALVKGVMRRLV